MEDGAIEPNELMKKIANPDDPHRKYLAGDVIPLFTNSSTAKASSFLLFMSLTIASS